MSTLAVNFDVPIYCRFTAEIGCGACQGAFTLRIRHLKCLFATTYANIKNCTSSTIGEPNPTIRASSTVRLLQRNNNNVDLYHHFRQSCQTARMQPNSFSDRRRGSSASSAVGPRQAGSPGHSSRRSSAARRPTPGAPDATYSWVGRRIA